MADFGLRVNLGEQTEQTQPEAERLPAVGAHKIDEGHAADIALA